MTEKIDLRRKDGGEYPPEIALLILKYNGVIRDAEKVAGFAEGYLRKIKLGQRPFTASMQQRVKAALENPNTEEPITMTPKRPTIPANCPPMLAELIQKMGAKKPVIRLLGTSDGTFYPVLSGAVQMPPAWIVKIKAALGQSLFPTSEDMGGEEHPQEQDAPQVPQFVPWDGKRVTAMVNSHPGKPQRAIKNVPEPLAKLLDKHGGSISAAARAMGYSSGGLAPTIEGKAEFTDKRQRKAHDALYGAAPAFSAQNEEPDKFTLGQAIVLTKAVGFDRVQEIADILSGRLIFKMNTSAGWLLIYKMGIDDLPKFKKIAMRDAQRIVCP